MLFTKKQSGTAFTPCPTANVIKFSICVMPLTEGRKGLSLVNADDEVPIIRSYFLVEERSGVLGGHKNWEGTK